MKIKPLVLILTGIGASLSLVACNLKFGDDLERKVICREGKFYGQDINAVIGGELLSENSAIARRTVLLVNSSNASKICSATLIRRDVLLTAAHCVAGAENAPEKLTGVFSTQPQCESRQSGDITAKKGIVARDVWVHPYYGSSSDQFEDSDLALVLLSRSAPADYALTDLMTDERGVSAGENILIAGYGASVGGGQRDRRAVELRGLWRKPVDEEGMRDLKDVFVKSKRRDFPETKKPILLFELEMQRLLPRYFAQEDSPAFTWIDQRDRRGACFGDSGGPAFVYRQGRLLQVGIASEELSDGSPQMKCLTSSRYINVAPQLDWISRGISLLKDNEDSDE